MTGLALGAVLGGCPGVLLAQSTSSAILRPAASVLWRGSPLQQAAIPSGAGPVASTRKERGLFIGAFVGGVAAGVLGNRVCRAYRATGGCTGDTLWWTTIGALLGGLIGATGARGEDP